MLLAKNRNIFSLIFFMLLMVLAYAVPRESFLLFISLITITHLLYLKIVFDEKFTLIQGIYLFALLRIGVIASEPLLSDDYYRFYWDGLCLHEGINPYLFLPSSLPNMMEKYPDIYENLNSKQYFSVYTPLNLLLFYISSVFKSKITFIVIYRFIIVLFETIGLVFLLKTLKLLSINPKNILFIYLNPIFIIEYAVNLHLESTVITFLGIGVYYFTKNQNFKSVSSWLIAIQLKLIPLLLFVSYFKSKGFKPSIVFGFMIVISLVIVYCPFLSVASFLNYKTSLSYYFTFFEFNSSIYLLSKTLADYTWFGFIYVPKIIFIGVLFYVFNQHEWNFYKSTLLIFSVYLLTSQSVHPWYIASLFIWIPFTGYFFPIVWAYFSMWTYYTYSFDPYHQHYFYNVVEYFTLAVVVFVELRAKKSIFELPIPRI